MSQSGPFPGYRSQQALSVNYVTKTRNSLISYSKRKHRLTPEKLADLKSKSTCHRCKKKGHWASDVDKCDQFPVQHSTAAAQSSTSTMRSVDPPPKPSKAKPGVLSFHMANLGSELTRTLTVGPQVDNAAPYSGLGLTELRVMRSAILPHWDGNLAPLPLSIQPTPFWQYGSGNHASAPRKIIASVTLSAVSDEGNPVEIRHLVIDGSSQWFIGRNVTR